MKKMQRNLWKYNPKYQLHVTSSSIIDSITEPEEIDERIVYIGDLEKRKLAYGLCGKCKEPGTGEKWCQPCNSKRFKNNFKNWTSGNKDIDELIQQSQLNAVYSEKCLEWIPFEYFQDVTYITDGGFGKIYSAIWSKGYVECWDIENQEWKRCPNFKVALKSLDNSSEISTKFLNEIKSHLQIYIYDVINCYGITQNPDTKNYMMILKYCENGNLRNYLSKFKLGYMSKINKLLQIARGLLDIHNAGKVHKDFHSGNILFDDIPYISDLGMCQPANDQSVEEGIYGVLPYMAPEVLRRHEYTKASDIYSFGIVMNEFISEEIPYNNIPHDGFLAINICKGLRPEISKDTPKLLTDLIMKCWDANVEIRPTAKELYQLLRKWKSNKNDEDSEIYSQINKSNKIKNKLRKKSLKTHPVHPQAIYTSRLLSFKHLPEPVNSSGITSVNLISECFDCQLSELDLNDQDD